MAIKRLFVPLEGGCSKYGQLSPYDVKLAFVVFCGDIAAGSVVIHPK